MKGSSIVQAHGILVPLLFLACASCSLAQARTDDSGRKWVQLCDLEEKNDAAERGALSTYSSPGLEAALLSSKSFWSFITDPSTPYMDRMAAASNGGSMLPPEELHVLWQAMVEVNSVPSGVNPSFCSAIAVIPRIPTASALRDALWPDPKQSARQRTVMVLGHPTLLPENRLSFPVTAEERDHSPWLWQMQRALRILFDRTNAYYGDIRYPARVRAAWAWPISPSAYQNRNDSDANQIEWNLVNIRSRALTEGAPHDILLFETILKLALNNERDYVAYTTPVGDLVSWGPDHHLEELAQAAQIIILQKTRWENVAAQTASTASQAAQYKGDTMPHAKLVKTATAVLAIGRWAMDRNLNPWNRYYSFVQPICKIVEDSPCSSELLRDPNDPRLAQELSAFESWFAKKQPTLELQAEKERPHFRSLANELEAPNE
jgi:hypothetical protein